ncbi:MAG: heptosyltransferase [Betaproteobacteria bacterium]|nr:heptosyltransferase [Betaproteobacteria bacterium]
MSRGANRLKALAGAILSTIRRPPSSARPANPAKILVLHELLLGDTLMLAPLLAALRYRYPAAELLVTSRPAYATLFSGRPYGVKVLPFSERQENALSALAQAADCDIVIVPGENRHAVFARALGAKWVVAFAGAKPAWKNRAVDELVALPSAPTALADMFALLAGPGAGLRFAPADWPAPAFAPFEKPSAAYAILHVGAGSSLRLWEAQKWRALAQALSANGLQVVWSAGSDERNLVRDIDPDGRYPSYAGKLDLAQLWQLLAGARLAVTLDTGVAHLAKLTDTPTSALFGPGSAVLFGKGEFWRDRKFHAVTRMEFSCRDQRHLFKREIAWVRRCNRTLADCPRARCMESITSDRVIASLQVK